MSDTQPWARQISELTAQYKTERDELAQKLAIAIEALEKVVNDQSGDLDFVIWQTKKEMEKLK